MAFPTAELEMRFAKSFGLAVNGIAADKHRSRKRFGPTVVIWIIVGRNQVVDFGWSCDTA